MRTKIRKRHFLKRRGPKRDAAVMGYDGYGHPVYEIVEHRPGKTYLGKKQFKYITRIVVQL